MDLEGGGNQGGGNGEDEVIEMPVLALDRHTGREIARFHRFIRPGYWDDYQGEMQRQFKPGCFNPEATAVPFPIAIGELLIFIAGLVGVEMAALRPAHFLFVTCGNWDVKTILPKQCAKPNPHGAVHLTVQNLLFTRWANLKDIFKLFYSLGSSAPTGMRGMLNRLRINLEGTHHLGMDDVTNLGKILQRMIGEGAQIEATAERESVQDGAGFALGDDRIGGWKGKGKGKGMKRPASALGPNKMPKLEWSDLSDEQRHKVVLSMGLEASATGSPSASAPPSPEKSDDENCVTSGGARLNLRAAPVPGQKWADDDDEDDD